MPIPIRKKNRYCRILLQHCCDNKQQYCCNCHLLSFIVVLEGLSATLPFGDPFVESPAYYVEYPLTRILKSLTFDTESLKAINLT